MKNPMEESHPPDEPIKEFSITAKQTAPGVWYVVCPEWNYKNELFEHVDRHIARVANEIKCHNDISGE